MARSIENKTKKGKVRRLFTRWLFRLHQVLESAASSIPDKEG